MFRVSLSVVVVMMLVGTVGAQTTWHVNDDAAGDPGPGDSLVSDPLENGTSEHPFDAIQEALDAAVDGDEVIVADGTYTGFGNRALVFAGKGVTLRSASGPESCIVDLQQAGRAACFDQGETASTVLDGISFINGAVGEDDGGALEILGTSPTVRNCHFRQNEAYRGGAIYVRASSIVLEGCRFDENAALGFASDSGGGAIYVWTDEATVRDCVFSNNSAVRRGGAAYLLGYGVFERCTVRGNTGVTSGGVFATGDAEFRTCLFVGNMGSQNGGAIIAEQVQLIGCTLVDNQAFNRAAVALQGGEIRNSILWGTVGHPQIRLASPEYDTLFVARTLIKDGRNGIEQENSRDTVVAYLAGNLDVDPRFAGNGDYRLAPDSPAVDAGDAHFENGPFDVEGSPRVAGCRVDLGCYEASGSALAPDDCDGDGVPDGCQIALDPNLDLNHNNVPDTCDIPRALYVDALADPNGDGSPERPFHAIAPAIDASVDGDEIVVRDGNYIGPENNNLSPGGRRIVMRSENGPDGCTIEVASAARGFLFASGETPATELRGFTIDSGTTVSNLLYVTGGSEPTLSDLVLRGWSYLGGGVLRDSDSGWSLDQPCVTAAGDAVIERTTIHNCIRGRGAQLFGNAQLIDSLVIDNIGGVEASENTEVRGCTITANRARDGAGVLLRGDAVLVDSLVENNVATANGEGGGVAASGQARIESCEIRGNRTLINAVGGGVFLSGGAVLIDSTIRENSSDDGGGLVLNGGTARRCRIMDNSAERGGAVDTSTAGVARIEECLLRGNSSSSGGGAARVRHPSAILEMVNCTVVENTAGARGGAVQVVDGRLNLSNSILWANEAGTNGDQAAVGANGILRVTASNLLGGEQAVWVDNGGQLGWLGGNLAEDPLFVDPNQADFRIADASPCVNEGDPNLSTADSDLDLQPRVQQCRVDMGAYESNGFKDCDGSGTSDACELMDGVSADCNRNLRPDSCDVDPSDPDGDGVVSPDCDGNGVPDECDPDCDGNGIPDLCDTDPTDPDGSGDSLPDCNRDRVPDVCQLDCNGNGVPDDCDVDPNDPDGNASGSADCNRNGVPDECEPDCNANGVPDDCDIDPNDPDLDGQVLPDCDRNGVPDDCQDDCNENGILDSCDVDPNDPDGDGVVWEDCLGRNQPDECAIQQYPGDRLSRGSFLAVDGEWAVLSRGNLERMVSVYRRIDGVWQLTQEISREDLLRFGVDQAIDGGTLAIGAPDLTPEGNPGGVFVYELDGGTWIQTDMLIPVGLGDGGQTGARLDLDGDTLLAGAYFADAAVVWRRDPNGWTQEAILRPESRDGEPVLLCGAEVALQGGLAVIGCQASGDVFVFRRHPEGWRFEAELNLPNPSPRDLFGTALAIWGDRIMVSNPNDDELGPGSDTGAVHTYRFDGLNWQYEARLATEPAVPSNNLGFALDLQYNRAIVGTSEESVAHTFQLVEGTWQQATSTQQFYPNPEYLQNLAFTGNYGLLGFHGRRTVAVTIIEDCDGDGVLDECQAADDINLNGIPDHCEPDCNGNGIPDVIDIDPDDPDGDGLVYSDCNSNLVPDECDVDSSDSDGNGYTTADCNANGQPDICEIDCDRNGTPDECDLANGGDADGDGVLDACALRGDVNGDGWIDMADLAIVLANFGCPSDCPGDATGDGRVDLSDLATILAAYGT